jgi:hypothetical protein
LPLGPGQRVGEPRLHRTWATKITALSTISITAIE